MKLYSVVFCAILVLVMMDVAIQTGEVGAQVLLFLFNGLLVASCMIYEHRDRKP